MSDHGMQPHNSLFHVSPCSQAKEEMRAKEALLKNFFANVDVVLRTQKVAATSQRWEVRLGVVCCRLCGLVNSGRLRKPGFASVTSQRWEVSMRVLPSGCADVLRSRGASASRAVHRSPASAGR